MPSLRRGQPHLPDSQLPLAPHQLLKPPSPAPPPHPSPSSSSAHPGPLLTRPPPYHFRIPFIPFRLPPSPSPPSRTLTAQEQKPIYILGGRGSNTDLPAAAAGREGRGEALLVEPRGSPPPLDDPVELPAPPEARKQREAVPCVQERPRAPGQEARSEVRVPRSPLSPRSGTPEARRPADNDGLGEEPRVPGDKEEGHPRPH